MRRVTKFVSMRATPDLRELYAFVKVDAAAGVERIVRRFTPSGSQPLIGDDPEYMKSLLPLVREFAGSLDGVRVIRFDRVADVTEDIIGEQVT